MSHRMVTIICKPGKVYHLETPNGIVNIRCGLSDRRGRSVDSVEMLPDDMFGEPKVVVRPGKYNHRFVRLKTVQVGRG